MLGKLLKHEFRSTGRIMLPVYGAVLLISVLANFSIRMLDRNVGTLLSIFFGLIVAAFVICIIGAVIMTLVLMIRRFYTNYLKDEGYLMHTLPVGVHGLVWSKMIVSIVWFAATFLVIGLVILLTALFQSGTNLAEIAAEFPSWAETKAALAEIGIRTGDLWVIGLEFLLGCFLGGLSTCLHFYAAMGLGHMFSKDKILLSVVFFVAINFLLNTAATGYAAGRFAMLENADIVLNTVQASIAFAKGLMVEILVVNLVQCAVLYIATVLSLKKGLNLA